MNLTVEIPDDLAKRLSEAGGDLSRRVLEALAADECKHDRLTRSELQRLLGMENNLQLDEFLKAQNAGETTIVLKPEQEQVLIEAINSGLAHTTNEALDQALDALRERLLEQTASLDESVSAAAARRLGTFGKRHGLSLGGLTIKELLRESRP
jgi:hypothetical protein